MTGVIKYSTHELLENFKESSELYKFYSNFNIDIDDTYDSYKKCNITTGTSNGKKCPTVKEITQKWKDEFNKITADGNNIAERCYYLILWVYDRIKGCDKNNYCISWYYGLLEKFWDESKCCDKDKSSGKEKVEGDSKGKDSDECNQPCKDKFIKTFNLDVLKKKRELYDFLEYYDHIKNKSSQIFKQNKKEYCDYINYIFTLYHKLEEEVGQRGLPLIYEKELNIFRKKFSEDNELSSIKSRCNINDSIIESIRSMDSANLSARSHEKIVKRRNISPDYGIYDPRKSDDKTVLNELSSEIYKEFDKDIATDAYNSTHCGNLNGDIQNICKKLARNLKELSTNNVTKNENHKDRCTHLNFWIYDAISKKHKNIDQNLSDMTEFADILHADIKINNDLIKKYLIENSKSFSPKETETQNQNSGNDLNTQGKDDTQRSTDNAEAKTLGKHTGKEVPTADTERTVHTGTTEEPGSTGDKGTTVPGKNTGTGGNTKSKDIPDPYKIVNYKELSKYNPCVFNYDCTLSECREMKHLYEYFKAYDTIKSNIKCGDGKNDKYFKYIKYISFLYNKHKEDCCSWSAEICPDYFLSCDEYYNPSKFVSALESSDIATCDEMLKAPIPKKSEDVFSVDPNSEDNMYIKYFTCSYVTDSKFEKKGLRCQQPGYSAHLNDRLSARRNVIKPQNNTSGLDGKKIIINGKTINVVLISDPYAKITGKDGTENSMPNDQYTLFPEIKGAARQAYVKQGEEACKNGKIKEGMEEYCKKSARYSKIINSVNSQSAKLTLEKDIENWEDIDAPSDTSFLNEILQQLPVRMGAVSLASLGAITMLFMYYKFTPFGSWLRNAMGGEKKMKHGNDIEPRKSLNYQQDHMPQISQKKRIKIAYQSS
ncbi:VIR protein [Plasmodium vivax]|uniref:VIR protein n=1 Tax=Plasmodium vivax TaxID=5855 RepID=A0A1G4EET3_PLAVI|nr:VIR protein [Plasmodium vivax]